MNRRAFLRLLALGVAGHTLDIDRLLWVPGQKTIFLPPAKGLSYSDIVGAELDRIVPHLASLFEHDDTFYKLITKRESLTVSGRPMRVPLEIKPGELL